MNFNKILCAAVLFFFQLSTVEAKIVIAHRGASGYLPEHTLESATLAFSMAPDFIEQDLVLTKDNILIVLHDIHLETVTNVEQVFPSRKRADGRYYALDFSLKELRKLRVHERANNNGNQVFTHRYQGNANFTIATFEEHIELIQNLNREFGKNVGFYPEIKAPAWHKKEGYDISKQVVKTLHKYDLNRKDANIYIQCFDFEEIKRLKSDLNLKTKLVQLIAENSWGESETNYDYLRTQEGLAELNQYVDGLGPWIPQLILNKENELAVTEFAKMAKSMGFSIHPYTHRMDQLLPNTSSDELLDMLFLKVEVDGVFSDFPNKVRDYLNDLTITN